MGKVYCRYCGKQIDEDATFCTHCGKEQNAKKESSWDADGLRSAGESFIKKSMVLFRSSYEIMRKVKLPQISAERAKLWRKRMKRIGKVVLLFLIIVIVFSIGAWGYDYYYNKYLPEKRLEDAVADIYNKYKSKKGSSKVCYAYYILSTLDYGYDNVKFSDIHDRMKDLNKEAIDFIKSRANVNDHQSQFFLGNLYAEPRVTFVGQEVIYDYFKADYVKAAYWFNEAASHGYVKAFNEIGEAYYYGYGVKIDKHKAIEWFKKGAEAGDAAAQYSYGRIFRDGYKEKTGTHKETRSTANYFSDHDRVIRKEFDAERDELITYYWVEVDDSVIVIPKDIEQARYWWRKAADQGYKYAKDLLEKVYE